MFTKNLENFIIFVTRERGIGSLHNLVYFVYTFFFPSKPIATKWKHGLTLLTGGQWVRAQLCCCFVLNKIKLIFTEIKDAKIPERV